jgi:glucosylceramidase
MYKNSKVKNNSEPGKGVLFFILIGMLFFSVQCQDPGFKDIEVYSSSLDGDRLTKKEIVHFNSVAESLMPVIVVDEKTRYQKIDGFGASFNEAGMICLNSLPEEDRQIVLRTLFDTISGAGFSLMKSPVAACDFSSAGPWYTYNDTPGDTLMNNFGIERDLGINGLIPYIKASMQHGRFIIQSPMDFAPDWMYNSLEPGKRTIKDIYYPALARYYSKYIRAYADNGITINYLNLFNESASDNIYQGYSSVTYDEMAEMIKNHVVPQLRKDGLTTKIQLGEPCFRPSAIRHFKPVLDDPEARKHISVLGVHGYDFNQYSSLTELHNKYPEYPIWMTEVCYAGESLFPADYPFTKKPPVTGFADGELWGNTIVNDMKNWVSGWIYWNMILDQDGGPWLVSPEHSDPDNNFQHPVVIINRETKQTIYTGLYYYLAHFSRFVRPGAVRIDSKGGTPELNFVGFLNTDGTMVLNIINTGNETDCKISWDNKMVIQKLKAHSITTLKWDASDINKKKYY